MDAVTLELQVSESADDAYEKTPDSDVSTATPLADGSDEFVGVRFQNVTIPNGATILRAVLSFVYNSSGESDPKGTLYGDDAAQFSTGAASDLSGRTSTTATVAVDLAVAQLNDDTTHVELADVATIVQEIVDRAGWSSGNALALLFQASADSPRDFRPLMYDSSAAVAPKLVVTYTTASPPAELYESRVASPDAESTFSSWSSLDAEISPLGGIAIAEDSDTLYAFMVDDDLTTIVMRTSGDGGANWGSRSTVAATGLNVEHLAAAAADDDDLVLFYSVAGGEVYAVRWNGSSWGTPAAWTNSLVEVTGLAAEYLLDFQVVVTGKDTALSRGVWGCVYGDGGAETADTWTALREVTSGALTSDLEYSGPSVVLQGTSYRLTFVESYGGDEAYDRLQWSTLSWLNDFNEEQWREPVGFDFEDVAGVALAYDASGAVLWQVSAAGVWLSDLPGYAQLDVSADVVRAEVRQEADGARVELELDNADGGYTAYGADDLGALQRGARLQLTPGYRTTAGAEVTSSAKYTYWVESIELITGARPRLLIRAADGWTILETWRARRQFAWAAGDLLVSQLLFFIAGRAGLEWSTSGSASDALTALQPAFTIHAGESGATAVRRLLRLVEDLPYFLGDDLKTLHTASNDSSGYSLGMTHELLGARYRDLGAAANRVRVVGAAGVYGDEADFADVERVERVRTVVDVNLTDGEDATDRAVAELRRAELEARDDELELFGVHCGVELYDVVDVTDAQAGLVAAARRVQGYEWVFDPRRGRYGMRLKLGKV